MRRALRLAARGWGQVAPNPLVGAVIVADGAIVGEGWHTRYGGPHAEVEALAAAGPQALGATMYVTLEPCNHTGKTPPCSAAIRQAGIARVVYAQGDPNGVAAGGADALRRAGVAVTGGVLESAAGELNAPFLHAARGTAQAAVEAAAPGRRSEPAYPWVTLKLAVSLDGAIADHTRQPGWISGAAAQRAVHRLRAGADAVAVGIGTVLADDPLLTVRHGTRPRVAPVRVVFDRQARLPLGSALVRSVAQAPVVVLAEPASSVETTARQAALAASGVNVVLADSLEAGLLALRARGVAHLLVEGGATLASSLVGAGRVDRLIMIQGSVILGSKGLSAFAALPPRTVDEGIRWRVVARRSLGDDSMTTYAVSEL